MAEARAAVRLAAVDTREFPSQSQYPSDNDVNRAFFFQWKNTFVKRFFRLRNQVKNGLWPTTFYNLKVSFLCIFFYLIIDPAFSKQLTKALWKAGSFFAVDQRMPFYLRALFLSMLLSFLIFVVLLYTRRMILRGLLSYRGWMYMPPNSRPSWKTMTWCAAVRIVSGLAKPTLYSCQLSLPRMPVPSLKDTMNRLLRSLEPLYVHQPEELERLRREADDFVGGPGKRLQRILTLKSWWAPNYVSDWWEKYVYLRSRLPLPNNSNFFLLDSNYWVPTCKPCSRAACLTAGYMDFKSKIDHETLPPLLIHNTVPLCMNQYERIFSSARIPGDEFDEIVQYKESKHIVLCYKNSWFRVDVADVDGTLFKAKAFQSIYEAIVREVDSQPPVDPNTEEAMIPALTALDRPRWAAARRKLITLSDANRYTVACIESAVFVIILEHRSYSDVISRGEYALHGDGRSLWFDKMIQVIVFADGHMALNVEHSPADAPVIGHLSEVFLGSEILEKLYDEGTGAVLDLTPPGSTPPRRPHAERLHFELGDRDEPVLKTALPVNGEMVMPPLFDGSLRSTIRFAYEFAVRNNSEVHLTILDHTAFGKGAMKACGVSPDSFIQLALQLAFLRDQNCLALTYESSMTRLYLLGRTETIRSLTPEAFEFLTAMDNQNVSVEEKKKLMRKACEVHHLLSRDAMNGRGCDRHLFALYVCARGLGEDLPFLTQVLSLPWTLSTSQTPLQQVSFGRVDIDAPYLQDKVSPGGGFGPVSDDGYGVSYLFAGENRLFFHVSSKQKVTLNSNCLPQKTDSIRFGKRIYAALNDLRALFQQQK